MKWKCNACGTTRRSNPPKCKGCEHTVLSTVRKTRRRRNQRSSNTEPAGPVYTIVSLLVVLGIVAGLARAVLSVGGPMLLLATVIVLLISYVASPRLAATLFVLGIAYLVVDWIAGQFELIAVEAWFP